MNVLHNEPLLNLNGYYRSDPMTHVNYVGGERKEEGYFLYYQFLDSGIWLSKTHHSGNLNFPAFLDTIDLELILSDPDHDEPLTDNKEFFYQSGKYEQTQNRIRLHWNNTLIDGKYRSWEFAIRGEGRLETALGDYGFEFVAED